MDERFPAIGSRFSIPAGESDAGRSAPPPRGAFRMMSLPFFGVFLALAATLAGRRSIAFALWLLSMAAMLVLFKLHASDPLQIAL